MQHTTTRLSRPARRHPHRHPWPLPRKPARSFAVTSVAILLCSLLAKLSYDSMTLLTLNPQTWVINAAALLLTGAALWVGTVRVMVTWRDVDVAWKSLQRREGL